MTYELTIEQKVFLQYFRNALYCDQDMYIIEPQKSYEFWKKIADLSSIHHVLPMIYEQVNTNKVRDMIDESLMKEWKFRTIQSVITQEKNTACFLKTYQELQKRGIHPLVVKGIILRSLYKNPEYRMSSDEDIWIRKEEYAECEKILLYEGFEKLVFSNHEKMSFDQKSTGFHIEVHLVPFATGTVQESMNLAFEGCFDRAKIVEIQGIKIRTLCDEDHMNYMVGHCFQHFSRSGVGIRQIADLMKYAETYGSVMDWQKVEDFTKKYHIYEFWKTMMAVARQYLGFSKEKAELPEKDCTVKVDMEELLVDIISGGVYGKSSQERMLGGQVVYAATKEKKGNLFTQMWKVLFVSQKQLQHRYPWVEKRTYLIPVAWTLRILRSLKRYKKRTIMNAVVVGNYRTQLAKKYHFI